MDKHTLYLDFPAERWESASPVGNGYTGAMIFGGVMTDRIQLTEEKIWSSKKHAGAPKDFKDKIKRLQELLLENKPGEADEFAADALKDSFERICSQETAGDLYIDFDGSDSDVTDYRRELDLLHGVSRVSFTKDGEKIVRETFASYPDRVIVSKHTGCHSAAVRYSRRDIHPTHRYDGDRCMIDTEAGELVGVESLTINGNVMTVKAHPATGGHPFTVKISVTTDGKLTSDGKSFRIENASATEYRIAIQTGGEPVIPDDDYETLKKRSGDDFASQMWKSDITFDDTFADMPANRRLERLRNDPDARDAGLTALYFRFGKYLLVASSRPGSLPAHLQGVWNNYTAAPWNADYHTNINLQMNYWHAETANLSDCALPLFDYMNKYLLESGKKTAEDYYGCRGTVVHHLSDIYGFTAPADGIWGLWPLGGAWLCYSMWEHWLFTRDEKFLKNTAYDYIHESARFFLDYMFERDGVMLSGPSTSPENHYLSPDGKVCSLCLSPSMDIEVIGGLLRFYAETEDILGLDAKTAKEAKDAISKLPPLKVGKHGQLMEWLEDYDEPEPGHRHISHLFALYPDNAINPSTPELYAAAKKTIERRLANGGGHTGWSCAWLTALYARLHDAVGVDRTLEKLFTKSTLANMFDTHPPFQIDGNFGASAAIVEALVQSRPEGDTVIIELLPACPYPDGTFRGLRVRGGAEVSAEWKDGRVVSCKVSADRKFAGKITANGKEYEIKLSSGETAEII